MKRWLLLVLAVSFLNESAQAQIVRLDVAYGEPAVERQVLDIYAPSDAKNRASASADTLVKELHAREMTT